MGTVAGLFGTNRTVPANNERNWGSQVSQILLDIIEWADDIGNLVSANGHIIFQPTASSFAASATLTPVTLMHRVQGTSAAVTLDATTAIADGSKDAQILVLMGAHAVNSVKINDGANTDLNGSVTLALGDTIALLWDSGNSTWTELWRNS
jgi:hypothetical protein